MPLDYFQGGFLDPTPKTRRTKMDPKPKTPSVEVLRRVRARSQFPLVPPYPETRNPKPENQTRNPKFETQSEAVPEAGFLQVPRGLSWSIT